MYENFSDPYCYPGTTVLRNLAGIQNQAALEAFEHEAMLQRSEEPLPSGRFSLSHYQALHHHLFQDVYRWAGKFRTVRIGKNGSVFCYPENSRSEMRRLFEELRKSDFLKGLGQGAFSWRAAHFLAELNAIHPFREGNGRTQLAFFAVLAAKAAHPIDLDKLDPDEMLLAMIESFNGDETSLRRVIDKLIS